MELHAVTKSVSDLFSVNKRYMVPRFQREYSWTKEEIDEFWEDICSCIKINGNDELENEEYFIGCIVLVGDDSKFDFLIVDGQQRLTTITILLRAIVEILKTLNDNAAATALYANLIEGTNVEGQRYFKLHNENPKPYFQNELQTITPQGISAPATDEEQRLTYAYKTFLQKLSASSVLFPKHKPEESIKAIRSQVLNFLKFIFVTAKSEDDAYSIFETLNARGINLSSVDLIKNWLFKSYQDTHPNDNAKDIWASIRTKLSNFSDLETFFRHYWNSKYAFASDDRLYKSFKEAIKTHKISSARDFLLELRSAAEIYRKIGDPSESDWPVQKEREIFRSLQLINQYKVTQLRPFLLSILDCHERKTIGQTELITTIKNLENFHFAFTALCSERASGLDGKYTRAAKDLRDAKSKSSAKAIINTLIDELRDKRPSPTKLRERVLNLTFSRTNDKDKKTIQTVFSKIERHLQGTSELQVAEYSLEHISDISNGEKWMQGVGNILPLDERINNDIKQKSTFTKKLHHYQKSNLMIVKEFCNEHADKDWNEEHSQARATKIADRIYTITDLTKI